MRAIPFLAALLFVGSATAQDMSDVRLVPTPNHHDGRGEAFAGFGGGAFNQDLGDVTGGAFATTVRVGADAPGRLRWLGAEVGFQGLSADTNATNNWVYNGILGGNLRANLPIDAGPGVLKPYVLGGLAWSHISTDTLFDSNDALAVPLGGGISYYWDNGFGLDGRFTYNLITGERAPIIQTGDSWNVGVNAGGHWGF